MLLQEAVHGAPGRVMVDASLKRFEQASGDFGEKKAAYARCA